MKVQFIEEESEEESSKTQSKLNEEVQSEGLEAENVPTSTQRESNGKKRNEITRISKELMQKSFRRKTSLSPSNQMVKGFRRMNEKHFNVQKNIQLEMQRKSQPNQDPRENKVLSKQMRWEVHSLFIWANKKWSTFNESTQT